MIIIPESRIIEKINVLRVLMFIGLVHLLINQTRAIVKTISPIKSGNHNVALDSGWTTMNKCMAKYWANPENSRIVRNAKAPMPRMFKKSVWFAFKMRWFVVLKIVNLRLLMLMFSRFCHVLLWCRKRIVFFEFDFY